MNDDVGVDDALLEHLRDNEAVHDENAEGIAPPDEEADAFASDEAYPLPDSAEPEGFDLDDTIRASTVIKINDGSRLIISFETYIDWTRPTGAQLKVVSRSIRENANNTHRLSTTFRIGFSTKKLGKTVPPMEMYPMEDDWPIYGLNVVGATLNTGVYAPGSAFVAQSNNISLTFSGTHLIRGTGEPADNPLRRVAVVAYGGFAGQKQFATPVKAAIRGGK